MKIEKQWSLVSILSPCFGNVVSRGKMRMRVEPDRETAKAYNKTALEDAGAE